MRPLVKVWEYHSKSPSLANIHIKILRGIFFRSPLRCSWLCQIGNKSLASLYTSSERTVNEMWGRLGCVCVFERVRVSVCVCAWEFSLTLPRLSLALHLYCGRKWPKCFVFHQMRQIVCLTPSNVFMNPSAVLLHLLSDLLREGIWQLSWPEGCVNPLQAFMPEMHMVCKLPGSLH